jgi:hypothetical protein
MQRSTLTDDWTIEEGEGFIGRRRRNRGIQYD